jgi:hypothetical protein
MPTYSYIELEKGVSHVPIRSSGCTDPGRVIYRFERRPSAAWPGGYGFFQTFIEAEDQRRSLKAYKEKSGPLDRSLFCAPGMGVGLRVEDPSGG